MQSLMVVSISWRACATSTDADVMPILADLVEAGASDVEGDDTALLGLRVSLARVRDGGVSDRDKVKLGLCPAGSSNIVDSVLLPELNPIFGRLPESLPPVSETILYKKIHTYFCDIVFQATGVISMSGIKPKIDDVICLVGKISWLGYAADLTLGIHVHLGQQLIGKVDPLTLHTSVCGAASPSKEMPQEVMFSNPRIYVVADMNTTVLRPEVKSVKFSFDNATSPDCTAPIGITALKDFCNSLVESVAESLRGFLEQTLKGLVNR